MKETSRIGITLESFMKRIPLYRRWIMKRLYVLTRSDLGLPYQAVQGAHAVAQFMLDNPDSEWKNGYLIFLSVDNESELDHWEWKIQTKRDTKVSRFREPDINNELTAIAVYQDDKQMIAEA